MLINSGLWDLQTEHMFAPAGRWEGTHHGLSGKKLGGSKNVDCLGVPKHRVEKD